MAFNSSESETNMAGWEPIEGQIQLEHKQLLEEGIVPAAAEKAMQEAQRRLQAQASEEEIWAPFGGLPVRPDYPFIEPSALSAIQGLRNGKSRLLHAKLSDAELFDRMHGAWLGRCVGCALGKPVEGFMGTHNEIPSWERQKRYLVAISPEEWPLRDYIPSRSPAQEQTGQTGCPASCRENIAFMESDDDIRYTVLGQRILLEHGRDFRSAHVANTWLGSLPYTYVCTAETQAYRNMVIGCQKLRSVSDDNAAELDATLDWHWIVHHMNPYREWIGAQIRVDSYGYAAPGDPQLAAEFAWRDARISHVKNGIYGAMLCAAMIAAAFATSDPLAVVEAGLAEIPSTSRLYAEMHQVLAICARHKNDYASFEAVIGEIHALLGHYHPVHTNNNAALCVAAVLLSGGDFHKGIAFAVMGGWDTDCNGATVGSIVGAMTGAARAPRHWTARLNDTLHSAIIDYHPIAISECARRSVTIARAVQHSAK